MSQVELIDNYGYPGDCLVRCPPKADVKDTVIDPL